MLLSDYLIDTAALLRDQNNLMISKTMLIRYINEARDQVAQDSGALRILVAGQAPFGAGAQAGSAVVGGAIPGMSPNSDFYTIPGQEMYPYGFATQTLTSQNSGYRAVCNVQNCGVSWGGAVRPVQNWMPWDQLQAYARSYNIGVFSYPFVWSASGAGVNNRLWLWPAPSIASEMEWDATCLPTKLYSDADYDALPDPYTQAVKYWAARLAFQGSLRFGMADAMGEQYITQLGSNASASDRSAVPDYYSDSNMW